MKSGFLSATGILSGTIIGAGVFSLPYVVSKIGIIAGVFYLFFFAAVYFFVYQMYAALLGENKGEHRFLYLARRYLPKRISNIASLSILVGLVFVLTIYLILAPSFTNLLAPELPSRLGLFIFWLIGSLFIFVKLSWQGTIELLGTLAILIIVVLVFLAGGASPLKTPLLKTTGFFDFILPFGPLLFAFAARPAIAKVTAEWRSASSKGEIFSLRQALFWGTFIPAFIYLIFAIGVLRLNPDVTPEALTGLNFLSPLFLRLLGLLGLLTIWTSYFIIGADIRETLKYDLKLPAWFNTLMVLFLPPLLFFAGFKNFLETLSFTGGLFLGLEGIFIIAMWRRAFPRNRFRYWGLVITLVFIIAIVYETLNFVI